MPQDEEKRIAAMLTETALICELVATLLALFGGEKPSTWVRLLALALGLAAFNVTGHRES
ncbi:hypothetical protein ABZ671_19335 [Micromonospora sp. NPDC006766]|uniref:hypothetical protein n=1 Tax=Micromonospora sp. NPDC006766 TaxID=3154778 RepID=UPI00340F0E50